MSKEIKISQIYDFRSIVAHFSSNDWNGIKLFGDFNLYKNVLWILET